MCVCVCVFVLTSCSFVVFHILNFIPSNIQMYLVSRCQYEHEDRCGVDYDGGHGSVCMFDESEWLLPFWSQSVPTFYFVKCLQLHNSSSSSSSSGGELWGSLHEKFRHVRSVRSSTQIDNCVSGVIEEQHYRWCTCDASSYPKHSYPKHSYPTTQRGILDILFVLANSRLSPTP